MRQIIRLLDSVCDSIWFHFHLPRENHADKYKTKPYIALSGDGDGDAKFCSVMLIHPYVRILDLVPAHINIQQPPPSDIIITFFDYWSWRFVYVTDVFT